MVISSLFRTNRVISVVCIPEWQRITHTLEFVSWCARSSRGRVYSVICQIWIQTYGVLQFNGFVYIVGFGSCNFYVFITVNNVVEQFLICSQQIFTLNSCRGYFILNGVVPVEVRVRQQVAVGVIFRFLIFRNFIR